MATAFCIATDATGVLVQPITTHEKIRQACKRGHYFVHVADRDHVFLEYTPKETSKAVAAMFKGYSGYVQADAKSVYYVLFRDPKDKPPDDEDDAIRREVGYTVRQKAALLRVLDDARLVLDNNRSERALRGTIATGRKAWLFVGSDDHAESAGHIERRGVIARPGCHAASLPRSRRPSETGFVQRIVRRACVSG